MAHSSYAYGKDLAGVSFPQAVEQVTAALAKEGFGVLTMIDVQATLKQKIDVDFRPYTILGACNPQLAHRALQADPAIGALLPCNVVIEAADGGSRVRIADPRVMLAIAERPELDAVAQEADARLRRVVERLH